MEGRLFFEGGAMAANLQELVARYKGDPESVYNTWFIESEGGER